MNNKILWIVVIIILAGAGGAFYYQRNKAPKEKEEMSESAKGILPEDWKTYTNEKFGYEMRYPSEWELVENMEGTQVAVKSPLDTPTDKSQESVVVTVGDLSALTSVPDLSTYSEFIITQIPSVLSEFTIAEGPIEVILGDNPAHKLRYSFERDGSSLQALSVWSVKDKKVYTVEFIGDGQENYDKFSKDAKKVISSFKFE